MAKIKLRKQVKPRATPTGRDRPSMPGAAGPLLEQGAMLERSGHHAEALLCYRQTLLLAPEQPGLYLKIGGLLTSLGRNEELIALYRQALAHGVRTADLYNRLGIALLTQGWRIEAVAVLEEGVAHCPDNPVLHYNLAGARQAHGDLAGAEADYFSALDLQPDFVGAHFNLARLRQQQGRRLESEDGLRRVLALNPAYGRAHLLLAMSRKQVADDPAIAEMERLQASLAPGDPQREFICFALGKAYEDLGRYARAFDCLAEGNRLHRGRVSYSATSNEQWLARLRDFFQPSFFAGREPAGVIGKFKPLFILGMPRSGTSLVEQILASHSRVQAAGELDELGVLVRNRFGSVESDVFYAAVQKAPPTVFADLGREYLERVARRVGNCPERIFITDKMPHNFIFIGLISLIFPEARVIHCRRQPMDNCWSLYKNLFQMSHNYTYDLDELGRYYRQYHLLMEHWGRVLPGFMHAVAYEDLVDDLEGQSRALLEYCGLSWEAECLEFHRSRRAVMTLSAGQVRRPIYRDSLELYRKYGDQLAPLAASLGALAG